MRTRCISYTLRLDGVVVDHGTTCAARFIVSPAPTAQFRCTAPKMPHLPVRPTPKAEEWIREHGLVPMRVGGLLYAGLVLLSLDEEGRLVPTDDPRVQWVKGGEGPDVTEGLVRMGAWELEFSVTDPKASRTRELPALPPVFVSSLIWAYVLAFSFVALAFNYPFPPPVDARLFEDETRHVAASFKPDEKEKVEPPKEEKIKTEPLKLVRRFTFHRRTVAPTKVQQVRARPILVQRRPTVIDLTKIASHAPAGADGDQTVDVAATPGVSVPVVVAAPPPPPPPPPPMAALPQPMKPKPMAPQKRVMKVKPKRLYFPRVPYPEEARQLGIEGRVKLRLYIDEQGRVYKVEVIKGLHPILDRAAVRAARRARYAPARDQFGRPMKSVVVVSIRFVLED